MNTHIKNRFRNTVLAFFVAMAPFTQQAKEIRVPSGAITTIQQGVNAAAPGDTVAVFSGTYSGVYVGPDKGGIKILAVGAPGSVRIALGSSTGFLVLGADNVRIQGFDISGVPDGIIVSAPRVSITGNRIGNLPGQAISLASWFVPCVDAEVGGNTIYGTVAGAITVSAVRAHVHDNVLPSSTVLPGAGISLYPPAAGCEVDHNILDCNSPFGLIAQNCGPSAGHHIHHNQANNHRSAEIATGIFLDRSGGCHLDHNVCDGNLGTGIYLGAAPNCIVEHNEANENGAPGAYMQGIGLDMSPDCNVAHNLADNNSMFGIAVTRSCGSVFEQNSASGNEVCDLFAPDWFSDSAPPACNSYLNNRGGTALPSLTVWDAKTPAE